MKRSATNTLVGRNAFAMSRIAGAASVAAACGWSAIATSKQATRRYVDVPMHHARRLRKPST